MAAVLTLILGLSISAAVVTLYFRSRLDKVDAARVGAERDMALVRTERDGERRSYERQVEQLEKATDEKVELMTRGREEFSTEMKAIAGGVVKDASEALQRQVEESRKLDREMAAGELKARTKEIEKIVAPVTENLKTLDGKIEALDKDRRQSEGAVSKMFENVTGVVSDLRLETGQLVSALKRPQVRGAWGEMTLKNVVKAANMTEHVDFDSQVTLHGGEDDGHMRPDMTVHLPTERDVVVDSKVPLDAYLGAMESTEDDRDAHLDRHAKQLKSHLDKLASKNYHAHLETPAEFVVCFLPNEAVYCAALDRDPGLLQHGAGKGVLIATPATLLALLYACGYGWRQASVEESAREIADAARELHKRAGKFIDDFSLVGKRLGSTVNAFNTATGSLEARVLPQMRRIENSGAASGRALSSPTPLDTPPRLVTAPEASDPAAEAQPGPPDDEIATA